MTPRRAPRREVQQHLVPLGTELRRTREALRPAVNQTELASRLGWGQAKVSLLESGRQSPTEADVRAWAQATGGDVEALLEVRERALVRRLDIREAARRPGGADALQGDLENLEAPSTIIAEYQPDLIPGLAQTPDYIRAWLNQPGRVELGDPPHVEDVVARRMSRQRRASGKRVTVAVQPAALTAVYGDVSVQRDQLAALAAAVDAGTLELIVATRPVALLHGFELIDDAAMVETVTGVHVMSDPDVVAQFRAALTRIRRHGATGRRARAQIEQAQRDLEQDS